MLHAVVVRPPVAGANLSRLIRRGEERYFGPRRRIAGCCGAEDHSARKAAAELKPEWKHPLQALRFRVVFDSEEYSQAENGINQRFDRRGACSSGSQAAPTYTVAYIAHAPLEPRAALASWENDKLTVWTGTQVPFGVRSELRERVPHTRISGPRHRARYGRGVRRKAYR